MFAAAEPRDIFLERSISALKAAHPEFSAEKTITKGQGAIFLVIALSTAALFFIAPVVIGALIAISCAVAYLANGIFRALLVWVGAGEAPKPAPPAKGALPRYTILVPLYREANVLPALVEAMRSLDYPGIR